MKIHQRCPNLLLPSLHHFQFVELIIYTLLDFAATTPDAYAATDSLLWLWHSRMLQIGMIVVDGLITEKYQIHLKV